MSASDQKQTYAPQKRHVRFTPNSDRKSGHRVTLGFRPLKADRRTNAALIFGQKHTSPSVALDRRTAVRHFLLLHPEP
jgi:hypothetical protein